MGILHYNIVGLGIVLAAIFILFIILCLFDFWRQPIVRSYRIATDKLSKGQSVKLVLIADLHSHIFGKEQKKLIDLIASEKPDLIALAGDIIDDKEPLIGAELLLEGIKGIAPLYYVTGNHEYYSNNMNNIKRLLKKHNVTMLQSQYKKLWVGGSPLIIGGMDDPAIKKYKGPRFDWEKKMYKAFSNLDISPEYKILLSHRPEHISAYKNMTFDLVLSGHAHGGQVRIPFLLNGLFTPNQGLFPKYAGGMYKHSELIHIVSRGVSFHLFRPRVFNPPEVVAIEVSGI